MVGLLVMIEKANALSPPGALGSTATNLAPVAFTVAPSTVVPMPEPGDAGPIYRQAVDELNARPSDYDRIPSLDDARNLKGLDLLAQATSMSTATIFAQQADRVISYDSKKPMLDELLTLGEAALHAGLLAKAGKDYDAALRYYDSAFSLGAKLAKERVVYAEFQVGLQLMSGAAGGIMSCAEESGNTARAASAKAFYDAYLEYNKTYILPIWNAISTPDDRLIARHTGDMFKLAADSQERMWRVEAALKLGRMKFDVGDTGRAADQRGAKAMLKRLTADSDPYVQIAAQKGLELDVKGFRTLK